MAESDLLKQAEKLVREANELAAEAEATQRVTRVQAEKDYKEALNRATKGRAERTASSWNILQGATGVAEKAGKDARAQAEKDYNEAVKKSQEAHSEAKQRADTAYKEALEKAEKAYQEAKTRAEKGLPPVPPAAAHAPGQAAGPMGQAGQAGKGKQAAP
jgi:colicin import membrane protein